MEDINKSALYVIMANEVTYLANNEQFLICFRLMDNLLEVHDDFVSF